MTYRQSKHLMGTDIEIVIYGDSYQAEHIEHVFRLFHLLELEFSRFLPTSSLSILNTKKEHTVSTVFVDVLKLCKKLYQESHGYFNPLINLNTLGYSKSFDKKEFVQTQEDVDLNFDDVRIQGNTITLQKNQTLDLGGIVKGFAVDEAKKFLDNCGYQNYIINAGGDIFASGINDEGHLITIGIDSPFDTEKMIATISVLDTGVATSGTYKRKRNINNTDYNHIINPITGKTDHEIVSLTIIADSCHIADAYATVCIAMGLEKTMEFLEEHNLEAIIVDQKGNIHTTPHIDKYYFNQL